MRENHEAPELAIYDATTSPSRMAWFRPDGTAPSQAVPGVKGFYYTRAVIREGRLDVAADCKHSLAHAVRSSLERMDELGTVLGAETLRDGDVVYCDETGPVYSRNIRVFTPLRLGGRPHHMLVRGVTELPVEAREGAELSVITGICLFSEHSLVLETDAGVGAEFLDGKHEVAAKVLNIKSLPELSFYETECIVRLADAVAGIVQRAPAGKRITVVLDVPRVQYYCYLLGAFSRGLVNGELMAQWFSLVDERHELVVRTLQQQLTGLLDGREVEFEVSAGLDSVGQVLADGVSERQLPSPGALMERLAGGDATWKLIAEVAQPKTYRDLVYLSYASEQLRRGLMHGRDERRLCVDVENRGEYMNFELSSSLMKKLTVRHPELQLGLLGLYCMERVLSNVRTGRPDHYFHDPSSELLAEDDGKKYSQSELLRELYGADLLLPSL